MSQSVLAVQYVLSNEGGFSDNPSDPGGATKFGISLRFLQSISPSSKTLSDIEDLTLIDAQTIYETNFWDPIYNLIESQQIANYIFDMTVNMGSSISHKIVQQAICSVTCNRQLMPDDGIFGSRTLSDVNQHSQYIIYPIRAIRADHYKLLVANNPNLGVFLTGWLNRTYQTGI